MEFCRPERMIDIMVGRQLPDEKERKEEAVWISEKLAEKIISQQNVTRSQGELADFLVEPVQHVLQFLQVCPICISHMNISGRATRSSLYLDTSKRLFTRYIKSPAFMVDPVHG